MKDTLTVLNLIATLAFGTVFGTWINILDNKIEGYKTASEFIKIVSDENSPGYAKSLALSSLLRYKLVDIDLLFSTAYRVEDEFGPGALIDLFYEYSKNHDPIDSPLGYIDFPAVQRSGGYSFTGWVVDKGEVAKPTIWIDNEICGCDVKFYGRNDIAVVFGNYNTPQTRGISFVLQKPAGEETTKHHMRVIVRNKRQLYTTVLDTEVCIGPEKVTHRSVSNEC